MRILISVILVAFSTARATGELHSCLAAMVPAPTEGAAPKPKATTLDLVEYKGSGDEALLELIRMFGQIRNHENGFSEKKKEFILGRSLSGGYSLEMTYELDGRTETPVYRLSSLDLINPFGAKENLSKRPLDSEGNPQKSFSFDGPMGRFESAILTTIQGDLLVEAITWGKRLEFLDAGDLRKIKNMADLRFLYLKYLKASQIDLHLSGMRKGYSKILFNLATVALFSYFTYKKAVGDDKPNHSELFLLLLNFKGTRISGLENTRRFIADCESKEPAIISKDFTDPEPRLGQSRVITVSEYSNMITVVEMTYEKGVAVDAAAIVVTREERIFRVLAKSLRAN